MKRRIYILLMLCCQMLLAAAAPTAVQEEHRQQTPHGASLLAYAGADVRGEADSHLSVATLLASAARTGEQGEQYDAAHPLIYEDAWEKWPYAFLGDNGEPKGLNVDLVKIVMQRLHIPYEIRLRSQQEAHDDLRTDSADLSFGVAADYNAPYGHFGKFTVCHYTYSMLVPRADSTGLITIADLRKYRNIVLSEGSRPWHYLQEKGIPEIQFTSVTDMEEEILHEASTGKSGALWNTMMMKWVINKYHLNDRYVAVPVDIPYGEYRFMSVDTVLLARIDSVCHVIQQEGEIDKLLTKWLYPEEKPNRDIYLTIILTLFGCLLLALVVSQAMRHYRRYYSRNSLMDVRTQMELILHSNKMKVWVYFPQTRRYAWMTSDGIVNEDYSSFEFSRFYYENDFNIIHAHVMEFLSQDMEPVTETLRCYSLTEPDKLIDVEVKIRELRDEYGKIYLVFGIQHDITDSKARLMRMKQLHQRYRTALYMMQGTMFRFDSERRLVGVNEVARIRLGIDDAERFIAEGHTLDEVDLLEDIDIDNCPDDLRFTTKITNKDLYSVPFARSRYVRPQSHAMTGYIREEDRGRDNQTMYQEGYYYVHFEKSRDKAGKVISYMVFVHNQTDHIHRQLRLSALRQRMEMMKESRDNLHTLRDRTLAITDIWMMRYHPDTKELLIYSRDTSRLPRLSQLSLIELADSTDIKKAFRVFHKLDRLYHGEIDVDIKTRLRNQQGEQRYFNFHLHPYYGKDGLVKGYFGNCRDITTLHHARLRLEEATAKAHEAEMLQGEFLKNTSFSMRQPLISISQHIRRMEAAIDEAADRDIVSDITADIQRLVTLSDDTMLLSRIEAGMLKLSNTPMDFCQLFRNTVEEVIDNYRTATVTYNVQDTYGKMMINGDNAVLKRILHEAVGLSARYTKVGTLSARYMYRKGFLTILVEDTGQGIPPSIYNRIYEPHIGEAYTLTDNKQNLSGLEIPICKALVETMGGVIEIESDPGRGTNIYIQLPIEKLEEEGTAESEIQVKNNII
ncbi:MAG: ATP-binding protein [Prevotella sp.]|nr:ATP-binding protein [Prevotella sp.]